MTLPLFLRALLSFLLPVARIRAQTDPGTLRVRVGDPGDAVVANASVEVRDEKTIRSWKQLSGSDGYCTFTPLLPGAYAVTVTAPGFQTTQVSRVTPDVAERRQLRVTLKVSGVTETVEVRADTAVVQAEEGGLGPVIKGAVAVELTLAGRRYTELGLPLIVTGPEAYASALDAGGAWGVDDMTPQWYDNFRAERGPMAQIARHRFTTASVWQLPLGRGRRFGSGWNRWTDALLGGWQFSTILTLRSGLAVNVRLAENGIDPATGRPYRFFMRNIARGPDLFNLDTSLAKQFAPTELRAAFGSARGQRTSATTCTVRNMAASFRGSRPSPGRHVA